MTFGMGGGGVGGGGVHVGGGELGVGVCGGPSVSSCSHTSSKENKSYPS